jgi:hypothetical protein
VPVLRAYHALRAVAVPAGAHEVVMRYRSADVARSLWISVALFVALVGATAHATWRERRSGREP